MEFYIQNETDQVAHYKGTMYCKDFSCNTITEIPVEGEIAPFSAKKVSVVEVSDLYGSFVEADVVCAGQSVKESEVLAPYKHLDLPVPNYKVDIAEDSNGYDICVKADCFAPFVELDLTGADAVFSDNYFHYTGEPVHVRLEKEDIRNGAFTNASDLEKCIQICSLRDSY